MCDRLRLASAALGVFLGPLLAACTGFGAHLDAGYGQFELGGDVALAPTVASVNLDTIQVDVQDDLGLDDQMGSPYGRIEADAAIVSVVASGFVVDQFASGRVDVPFGEISAGTDVNTKLDLRNLKAAVVFNLIDIGVFRLAPGIGASVFDMDLEVQDLSLSTTESIEVLAPVPMAFVQAEVDVAWFEAVLDVGGMYIEIEDADGAFVDVEALVRFKPADHLEIFAGLRYIMLDVEGESEGQDFQGDLYLTGWMIGGGIRF